MANSSTLTISWSKIGLAILPGMWFILATILYVLWSMPNIPRPIPFQMRMINLAVAVCIVFALALGSWRFFHRFEIWCLPAFGVLLWELDQFVSWWMWAARNHIEPTVTVDRILYYNGIWSTIFTYSAVIASLGSILIGIGIIPFWLFWLYKTFRRVMTRWSLGLLGLMVVHGLLSGGILFLPISLSLVVIGQAWAKEYGLRAGLFLLVFVPEYISLGFLGTGIPADLTAGEMSLFQFRLDLAAYAANYFPISCFLVVLPVGLLRARSKRGQLFWLIAFPLFVLISISVIVRLALQGIRPEYADLSRWIMSGDGILSAWLPILLGVILYNSSYQEKVAMTEVTSDGSSKSEIVKN